MSILQIGLPNSVENMNIFLLYYGMNFQNKMSVLFIIVLWTLSICQQINSVEEEVFGQRDLTQPDMDIDSLTSRKISIPKLEKLLKKIDSNNDGFISKDELIKWNLQIAEQNLKNDIDRDFQMFDTNKNGQLTRGEMLSPFMGYTDEAIKRIMESKDPQDEQSAKFLAEDKLRFDAADIDNDGQLNKYEYQALLNSWGYPKMLEFHVKDMMNKDENNDSKLNEKEFKHFFYATEDNVTESQEADYRRIMRDYDTDKDGLMSIPELHRWYAPDLSRAAEVAAEHLFESADKNGDSLLSYDEVIEDKEKWHDSPATWYGEHIRDEL